jgi:hypothetical protein
MPILNHKQTYLLLMALVACAHSSLDTREPAALKVYGLEKPELRKKLDQLFQTNGILEKSLKDKADTSQISIETLSEADLEGGIVNWRSVGESHLRPKLHRLISGQQVGVSLNKNVSTYTYVTSTRGNLEDRHISHLQLDNSGDFIRLIHCDIKKGVDDPYCFEISDETCRILNSQKSLAAKPARLIEFKKHACHNGAAIDIWAEEALAGAAKWAEDHLGKDGKIPGVGSSKRLLSDDMKEVIKDDNISKASETAKPPREVTLPLIPPHKLNCNVEDVLANEQETLINYADAVQPVAQECQRVHQIYSSLGKERAVRSETKKSTSAKPHASKPKKRKKVRVQWFWE